MPVKTPPAIHDPRTCPTCASIIAREAYLRGVERAKRMEIPLVVAQEPTR